MAATSPTRASVATGRNWPGARWPARLAAGRAAEQGRRQRARALPERRRDDRDVPQRQASRRQRGESDAVRLVLQDERHRPARAVLVPEEPVTQRAAGAAGSAAVPASLGSRLTTTTVKIAMH